MFSVLAHPVRRLLVQRLASRDWRAGELAAGLDVSRSAVSQHLRLMLGAGVVQECRAGRERWYRLERASFQEVRTLLAELDTFWERRLDALGELLDVER